SDAFGVRIGQRSCPGVTPTALTENNCQQLNNRYSPITLPALKRWRRLQLPRDWVEAVVGEERVVADFVHPQMQQLPIAWNVPETDETQDVVRDTGEEEDGHEDHEHVGVSVPHRPLAVLRQRRGQFAHTPLQSSRSQRVEDDHHCRQKPKIHDEFAGDQDLGQFLVAVLVAVSRGVLDHNADVPENAEGALRKGDQGNGHGPSDDVVDAEVLIVVNVLLGVDLEAEKGHVPHERDEVCECQVEHHHVGGRPQLLLPHEDEDQDAVPHQPQDEDDCVHRGVHVHVEHLLDVLHLLYFQFFRGWQHAMQPWDHGFDEVFGLTRQEVQLLPYVMARCRIICRVVEN
ncbi:hypothetical protein C0J52_10729, partial [Blattella germanica]